MSPVPDAVDTAKNFAHDVVTTAEIKPFMRGKLHLIATPVALIVAIVLVVLADSTPARFACLVFGLSGIILFGCSATYHLGNWSEKTHALLRRMDHSNIFLLISGTYTPIAYYLLDGKDRTILLTVVWIGAAAGIALAVLWLEAPRWLTSLVYIALGWVAVWYLPTLWRSGSPAVVLLIIAGGLAYTIGAVIYAMKRPNPWPKHFGFHEIFHVGTIIGWGCHVIAVFLAMGS